MQNSDEHKSARGIILVIDDEESMHDSCEQVLTREKYQVLTTFKGARGVQLVREYRPDLVLLDFKLAGESGEEIMASIAAIDPTVVVVVITGYATIESAVEAMKRGASEFLPKPFTPEELRLIVRRGMEKRRLLTEKRRLEEENQRIRENFVSIITHEMRSPLVSVQQYINVMLEGYTGPMSEKQLALLAKCRQRIQWLLSLVTEWLDMSRMQQAIILEQVEMVDISDMLTEALDMVRGQAEKRSIVLKTFVNGEAPEIEGNRETLLHLFINLYTNAVKYNVEGGSITTRTERTGDCVKIMVEDTGIGIPEENRPFIFDEFFRVRKIREKVRQTGCETGTGLGLAIAKRIVDAHNGHITVESCENKGSVFTVHLPITQPCGRGNRFGEDSIP